MSRYDNRAEPKVSATQNRVSRHKLRTAAGQLRLYVNGRLAGTAPYTAAWRATGSFAVGRGRDSAAPTDFFPGAVDQVRVWSRALSDADVAALI